MTQKMNKKIQLLILILLTTFIYSCEENTVPKPLAYPKISFPTRSYTEQTIDNSGISFLRATYSEVKKDSSRGADEYWYNIIYPQFKATIHLSYKKIKTKDDFYQMQEDAHGFAYKHTSKADDILESYFSTKNNVSGLVYEIEGNTASSVQFFATDSISNYIRGALYFNTKPNTDSLEPVVTFLRKDIDTFIQTLKFNQKIK